VVTFATVEAYIAAQPPQTQTRLGELREAVRGALPDAQEVISYGMPTYKLPSGFVSFGAAQRHCALYGSAADAYPEELKAYSTAKGTVRFPLDRPIPQALVRKLVQAKFTRAP
jgi:uncharacterized protein YdhG (YjbR/CyaY superfamily)